MTLVVIVILFSFIFFRQRLRDGYEVFSVRFFPNAQRAFSYGVEHLSSDNPGAYNIDLASYFFMRTLALDPKTPYLYHQLARIAFLQGHFGEAMRDINTQIEMYGTSTPNSYYVRGLIEGYAGDYDAAVRDYGYFLSVDPANWASANDYAWVLLKANKPKEAVVATDDALKIHPTNPWLLSTNAVALYEIGDYSAALISAKKAQTGATYMTANGWLLAYPGNDPQTAQQGIVTMQKSIQENIHKIEVAISGGAIQSN